MLFTFVFSLKLETNNFSEYFAYCVALLSPFRFHQNSDSIVASFNLSSFFLSRPPRCTAASAYHYQKTERILILCGEIM